MRSTATYSFGLERVRFWHLAVLFLVLYLTGLGSGGLIEPDEGRYSEIPQTMLSSGDWVTPRLNGVLYFEKPALYYWLTAASMALFGENEFGARFVNAFAGVLGILLTFLLGRSMGGHRVGVSAALILGLSPLWIASGRVSTIDVLIATLISATLACYWWASREDGSRTRLAWYGMFAGSALAVLAKGLIGIVIPGAVIFFHILFTVNWRLLKRVPWITGTLIFSAIAVPWHVIVAQRNESFLWFYFIHEHLMRYTTTVHERTAPFWYFVPVILLGLMPWSGLFPAAATLVRKGQDGARRSDVVFLLSWFGFVFLFFSASSSKLIPYMLPALPVLAILFAMAIESFENVTTRARTVSTAGLGFMTVTLIVVFGALGWLATGQSPEMTGGVAVQMPLIVVTSIVACFAAVWALANLRRGVSGRTELALYVCGVALVIVIGMAAKGVADSRTAKPIAEYIESSGHPDWPIVAYQTFPQTLRFYTKRQVDLVDIEGELKFGISQLTEAERAERFTTLDVLREKWNDGPPMYLVIDPRKTPDLEEVGLAPGTRLVELRKFVLLTNRPGGTAAKRSSRLR